jgi:hypothetical protein
MATTVTATPPPSLARWAWRRSAASHGSGSAMMHHQIIPYPPTTQTLWELYGRHHLNDAAGSINSRQHAVGRARTAGQEGELHDAAAPGQRRMQLRRQPRQPPCGRLQASGRSIMLGGGGSTTSFGAFNLLLHRRRASVVRFRRRRRRHQHRDRRRRCRRRRRRRRCMVGDAPASLGGGGGECPGGQEGAIGAHQQRVALGVAREPHRAVALIVQRAVRLPAPPPGSGGGGGGAVRCGPVDTHAIDGESESEAQMRWCIAPEVAKELPDGGVLPLEHGVDAHEWGPAVAGGREARERGAVGVAATNPCMPPRTVVHAQTDS